MASRARAETPDGLRSITLRRICLGIVLAGIAWNLAYQHTLESAMFWYVALLIYGLTIAGAVQHVYRNVRVGRAETAAMLTTTLFFVLATLVAPRQVGTVPRAVPHGTIPVGPLDIPTPQFEYVNDPLLNAPLLHLFGYRSTVSAEPWTTIAYVLAIATMIGVCAQWVLVARLGRHRAGVFNPVVTSGGLTTAATLDAPLGTSVTRPATGARSPTRPRRRN